MRMNVQMIFSPSSCNLFLTILGSWSLRSPNDDGWGIYCIQNHWTDQNSFISLAGYEGAARHLSKEWDVQQPDLLPFAPHVGKHALVSVLNKGLLYDAYNREASRVCWNGCVSYFVSIWFCFHALTHDFFLGFVLVTFIWIFHWWILFHFDSYLTQCIPLPLHAHFAWQILHSIPHLTQRHSTSLTLRSSFIQLCSHYCLSFNCLDIHLPKKCFSINVLLLGIPSTSRTLSRCFKFRNTNGRFWPPGNSK